MTGPRAAVRITINDDMIDEFGTITSDAFRSVRGLLWDIPDDAPTFFDLGPLRTIDYLLLGEVALRPCARRIVFESPNWRLAVGYVDALSDLLAEVAR